MENEIYNKKIHECEKVYEGEIKRYKWCIFSIRGSHPCAYVAVDKKNKHYKEDYEDELEEIVHGGITFCDKSLKNFCEISEEKWVFGWDYAHREDYVSLPRPLSLSLLSIDSAEDWGSMNGKKWSKEEILEDIERFINFLEE